MLSTLPDAAARFAALPPAMQANLFLALMLAASALLAALPSRRARRLRRPTLPQPTPVGSLRRARPGLPA